MGEPADSLVSDAHFDLSRGCLYSSRSLGAGGKHRVAVARGSSLTLGWSKDVPNPRSWVGELASRVHRAGVMPHPGSVLQIRRTDSKEPEISSEILMTEQRVSMKFGSFDELYDDLQRCMDRGGIFVIYRLEHN